jgi:hypothetical protein
MLAVSDPIRRRHHRPPVLASGLDTLLPANRGNDAAQTGMRRLSCHE